MNLKILSPAKVNLFLLVTGKREDGYHDILSLIQPISLYDEIFLEVKDGSGITVSTDDAACPGNRENIASVAAELFLKEAGLKKKVSVKIGKNIPVAAGLGGGSSDAASVLMGLNGLLCAPLSKKRLMDIALRIGSDVPFFILKSPAIVRGRGEVLEKIKLPRFNYVLINPGFSVSSGWAYGNLDLTKKTKDNIFINSKEFVDKFIDSPWDMPEYLINDLEAAVSSEYPVIKGLEGLLMDAGASAALMSGSGPTVFGVFSEEARALKAYSGLKNKIRPPLKIFIAGGL